MPSSNLMENGKNPIYIWGVWKKKHFKEYLVLSRIEVYTIASNSWFAACAFCCRTCCTLVCINFNFVFSHFCNVVTCEALKFSLTHFQASCGCSTLNRQVQLKASRQSKCLEIQQRANTFRPLISSSLFSFFSQPLFGVHSFANITDFQWLVVLKKRPNRSTMFFLDLLPYWSVPVVVRNFPYACVRARACIAWGCGRLYSSSFPRSAWNRFCVSFWYKCCAMYDICEIFFFSAG